ncbi:MAG TPA: hypothetical protein VLT35_01645 [Methanocella sp.]|nr:hypothetical protein [Methanocella sp.]
METKNTGWPDLRDLAYILILFLVTRVALSALGVAVRVAYWGDATGSVEAFTNAWDVWDGHWYINIARDGYSAVPVNQVNMANYAFFPLYPLLVRLAAFAVGNYALAGFVVSNVCLLVACYYLYRYVALDEAADRATARRSVRYLLLFPTAFLFSAVLSEALFVALAIACLYYARRGNWLVAGPLGFLVPLTRLPGLAIVVPLAYDYLRQRWPAFPRPDIRRLASPWLVALLLPPLGLGLWMAFNYHLTGDLLAFVHIQSTWGGKFVLPPVELVARLDPMNGYIFTGALFTIVALVIMLIFYKKVDFGAWLLGVLLIVIPLFSAQSCYSMLRYLTVVFPLCIIFAKLTKDWKVDLVLSAAFIALQVVLMVVWTTWSPLIV